MFIITDRFVRRVYINKFCPVWQSLISRLQKPVVVSHLFTTLALLLCHPFCAEFIIYPLGNIHIHASAHAHTHLTDTRARVIDTSEWQPFHCRLDVWRFSNEAWILSTYRCLENREYGRRDPLCWPHDNLYQQKLALTSLTSGGRSVGIVSSRTKATELVRLDYMEIVVI
jgi:hypothetical protein